ncbi:MAG: 16S rRNA (guanine(527)-N(7))-methyltransferase RsmG [Bdellovibrio sp.]
MYFEKQTPIFLQLGFRQDGLKALKSYIDLLWAENENLNLISRKMTYEELIDNHVIDCLLPLSYFPRDKKKVADFGSGGGLPGVLFAIQFPEAEFHLYEKSPKKQDFLNLCQKLASNIHVHGEIPPQLEGVDLVTARGFKPLDVILEVSRAYYKKGGSYFLLKARHEKISEEQALAQKKFKDLSIKITPLQSPVLEVERHLVQINGF